MRAFGFRTPSPIADASALVELDVHAPEPGPHDIVVRIRAVSLNPVDIKVRSGAIPLGDGPHVIGYDAAGTVVAVGARPVASGPATTCSTAAS